MTDEVHFADFGRRAILNLRQTLVQRYLNCRRQLYAKYKDKIGHIIAAEVYQVWKKEILLLDDDGNELLLPKSEQIPTDFYRKGETVRAIVQRVDNYNNNPKILLSRTDKVFLQRLFELEVPEINDGLITIKRSPVSRESVPKWLSSHTMTVLTGGCLRRYERLSYSRNRSRVEKREH